MEDTESQVTGQDEVPEIQGTEEASAQPEVDEAPVAEEGKTPSPEKPVQEPPSIKQEPVKQARVYSQEEWSKQQSTFTRKMDRLSREIRLANAALSSRIANPVDPMDPATQVPTPEELAHRKFQQENEAEDRAEAAQFQQMRQVEAFRDSLQARLKGAGIDPLSKEAMERVGALYSNGDFEGARTEVAVMIAEKRLEDKMKPKAKQVDPAAQARQQAKEEGAFAIGGGKSPNAAGKPLSDKEYLDRYGQGLERDHARAKKILANLK